MIKDKSQLTRQEILDEIKVLTQVAKKNKESIWNDTPEKMRLRDKANRQIEELMDLL